MSQNKNPRIGQFFKMLDREKPLRPSSDSMMEAPTSIYFIIKQMYNFFKKDNESRILQNKIYDLKIHDVNDYDGAGKATPVKIQTLLSSHTAQQSSYIISNLITLKTYLPSELQRSLIANIAKQIARIDNISTVLKFFGKVLKDKQCLNDKHGLYKVVEKEMTNKIAGLMQHLSTIQIKEVCKFLYGLPVLSEQILLLIAIIFEKIEDYNQFAQFIPLYTRTYESIYSKGNSQNKEALIKISMMIPTDENIKAIKSKLSDLYKKNKYNSLSANDLTYLGLLHDEAVRKINQITASKMNSQQGQLSDKNKKIINFVFEALQSEAIINLDKYIGLMTDDRLGLNKVWLQFIKWYQEQSDEHIQLYIAQNMSRLLQSIFQSSQSAARVMSLLLLIEGGLPSSNQLSNKCAVTDINRSVSNFVIRQLISGFAPYSKYFTTKLGRQMMVFGLMNDKLETYEPVMINPENLQYADSILQTFKLPSCCQFYKSLLASSTRRANFEKYLFALLTQKPKIFKDFFIYADSTYQSQVFEIQDHYLLKFFWQNTTGQIAVAFLRDMATYPPSPYNIQTIDTLIKSFKGKSQQKVIYHQAVRTLHIILSTREVDELTIQFKKHLKDIIESKVVHVDVLKNIPQKMKSDLSAFYASAST